jgi:hypothetical protein
MGHDFEFGVVAMVESLPGWLKMTGRMEELVAPSPTSHYGSLAEIVAGISHRFDETPELQQVPFQT